MSNYNPYQMRLFNHEPKRSISPNLMMGSFSNPKIGYSKGFTFKTQVKRDITPMRKFNRQSNKNASKKTSSRQIKMEGDLLNATKSPNHTNTFMKRSNSPFQFMGKKPNSIITNSNILLNKKNSGVYRNRTPDLHSSKSIMNRNNGNLILSPGNSTSNGGKITNGKGSNGQVMKTPSK